MAVTINDRPIPTGEDLTLNNVWAIFQENDRIMKETIRKMNLINEQMGGLRRSFGEMAEHLAAQSVEEKSLNH
jgi:hypothetical protein